MPDFDHAALRWRLRGWIFTAFFVLCAETIFSIPYRSVQLATHSVLLSWIAGLFAIAAAGLLYAHRFTVFPWLRAGRIRSVGGIRLWTSSWLIIGLLLRVLWAVLFPATLKADGLIYFSHARDLAERYSYAGAFWPPGYPFFLFPFLRIFGIHAWITTASSLVLFVCTFWIVSRLAERVGGEPAVRVAVLLVAIWPGYLTLVGVGSKELLLAALLPGAVLAYLSASHGNRVHKALLILAGALSGWAVLSQPSNLLLLPAVFCGIEIVRRKPDVRSLLRLAIVLASTILVVVPWTVRNYLVYHHVVLVTTNGGSVFYRANNPKANANYIAEGEQKLPSNEFEADREGYRLAFRWMRENPATFLALCIRKQVAYLGDDSLGIYETLKRSLEIQRGYFFAKMIGNLFWLGLWCILFWEVPRLKQMAEHKLEFAYCVLPLLFQLGIDSLFESSARHHVPCLSFVAVLVGAALSPELGVRRAALSRPERVASAAA